ncbi:MAG: hypothetical protein DLM69_01365 [Candidatus Chloroheliales bacterium]|nr:MAG: hypothetical protein DLM69_01365 [Chloroflexota bacterium]
MSDEKQEEHSNGWGGVRANAGRKPTRERNAETIAETEAQFFTAARNLRNLKRLQTIADNPKVKQEVVDRDGNVRTVKAPRYSGREQVAALKELLNRGMGVPVQRTELTGGGGGPLTFEFIIEPPSETDEADDDGDDTEEIQA